MRDATEEAGDVPLYVGNTHTLCFLWLRDKIKGSVIS